VVNTNNLQLTESQIIPIFPLHSVLFPRSRLSLQIFETRYVDMVRKCLREDSGFGIVLIRSGSEVMKPGEKLDVQRTGTYCRIIDWDQLPNRLLGISVEGICTFELIDLWQVEDKLCMGKVRLRNHDGITAEPLTVPEEHANSVALLNTLAKHPEISHSGVTPQLTNFREVAWLLSAFLPLPIQAKQQLLELSDPGSRIELIEQHLLEMHE
jgi:Lon protease-like protein